MGKQDIINYVMETPHNTNPKMLRQKIEDNFTWDELSNKPFYEEKVEREIRAAVAFPNLGETDLIYGCPRLIDGAVYALYLDGVRYEGECSYGEIQIPNELIIRTNNDEDGRYHWGITAGVGRHTLSVYKVEDGSEIEVYSFDEGIAALAYPFDMGLPEDITIEVGEKYIVGLNNKYYEFTAKEEFWDNGTPYIAIGNMNNDFRICIENGNIWLETIINRPIKLSLHELVDGEKVEVLPEVIAFQNDSGNYPEIGYHDLMSNDVYAVYWDGVRYECPRKVAYDLHGYECEYHYIGNLALIGGVFSSDVVEDTGEPFLIRSDYGEMSMSVCNSVNVEYTLCKVENVVHTIDPKYLYDAVITTEAGEIHPDYLKWEVGDFDSLYEKCNNGGRPRVLLDTRYLYDGDPAGGIFEACGVACSYQSISFLFWSIDGKFYDVIYDKGWERWSVYRSDRIEKTKV